MPGRLQRPPLTGPLGERIDAELPPQPLHVEPPLLQTEHGLADQEVAGRGREAAADRQPARLDVREIVVPVGGILVVPAGEVAEARHAERRQVAPLPEHVAIVEPHPPGIPRERVAAGDD
ncbi:MAG: hypothetical protein ACK559_19315, partial [bacterium]